MTATKSRKSVSKTIKNHKVIGKPPVGTRTPKATSLFQGTVQATKVLNKRLDAFKNTVAIAWMILDETNNTVCYCNSYGQTEDNTMPRASWLPEIYTYPIKPAVVAKKLEEYREIEDREDWPAWIIPSGRKPRKAK